MKRTMWSATITVTALVFGPAGSAFADDDDGVTTKTVNVIPVTWTMTAALCPNLPPGTTLTGTGTLTDEIDETTYEDGTVEVDIDSAATGTATDQRGKTYSWRYDNELEIENSTSAPAVFNGVMIDKFTLKGAGKTKGKITLKNGFVADFFEDRSTGAFAINPRSSYGDPFLFPDGGGLCDPL